MTAGTRIVIGAGDYGDANDPNADPPPNPGDIDPPGGDPLILTDPDQARGPTKRVGSM